MGRLLLDYYKKFKKIILGHDLKVCLANFFYFVNAKHALNKILFGS